MKDLRKYGNTEQTVSAYKITFSEGKEKGKKCVLIHNGGLELLISESNALDITYLKYNGNNISFLTKNGINANEGEFPHRFEGGFLYTCGLDNIGTCVEGCPMHGSLHYQKANNVCVYTEGEKITVTGEVTDGELFGKNLLLKRKYEIFPDKVILRDTVVNRGYTKAGFVILYHNNYGYPFLDENLKIKANLIKSEGLDDYAKENISKQFIIEPPIDGGNEQCFYNYVKDGVVELINDKLNAKVKIEYDVNELPHAVEWKSMVSGDYALGIEPTTSRFDDFKLVEIEKESSKELGISITFSEIK